MNYYEMFISYLIEILIPKSIPSDIKDIYQYYGQVGDFFGGFWGTIIGTITLLIIVLTWRSTRKIDRVSKVYQVFAEMLRTHEEIVSSIRIGEAKGRDAFSLILSEFYAIYEEIYNFQSGVFRDLDVVEKINMAYIITYYGAQETTPKILERHFPEYPCNEFCKKISSKRKSAKVDIQVKEILQIIRNVGEEKNSTFKSVFYTIRASNLSAPEKRLLSVMLQDIQKVGDMNKLRQGLLDNIQKNSIAMEFGGHQNRLSHYYRNLYSAFMFIDEQKISKKEKISLAKVLRSKLSNYEQAMLAINILSVQGNAWMGNGLLDKYSPIKNIPQHFFRFDDEFKLKGVFPGVIFEWE